MAMPAPSPPPQEQESPHYAGNAPIVFEGFSTLNTDASRPGIENDQMAWCDGFMPLGKNNLRTLYGLGPEIFTLIKPPPPPPPPPPPYAASGVVITTPPVSMTIATLAGLPGSYQFPLYSTWVYLPDDGSANHGTEFVCNGGAGPDFVIINDDSSPNQIAVTLTDASSNPIVFAEYDLTGWVHWVNILISADTAANVLQVYAGETALTPVSITWSSTNPVGNLGGPWVIDATISGAP